MAEQKCVLFLPALVRKWQLAVTSSDLELHLCGVKALPPWTGAVARTQALNG